MNHQRGAPLLGIAACLLALVAVAAPYVAVPEAEVDVVGQYYGLGAVGPLAVALLAMVGVIAFAAGLKERSDPSLIAGLMVTAGVFSVVAAVQWAFAVPSSVGQSASTAEFLSVHRWTVPVASALIAVAAGWYAWALGLFGGRPSNAA